MCVRARVCCVWGGLTEGFQKIIINDTNQLSATSNLRSASNASNFALFLSWRWLEVKLTELGFLTSSRWKVGFVLDKTSMFKVRGIVKGRDKEHSVKVRN